MTFVLSTGQLNELVVAVAQVLELTSAQLGEQGVGVRVDLITASSVPKLTVQS